MRSVVGALLLALVLGLPDLPSPSGPSPAAAAPEQPVGVWPLEPEPEVVQGFSPPPHPYAPGHRGVDLAGHAGQPVRAALAGTVGFAGSIAGKPVVTVLHGGRRTTYEPVVASVARGDEVAAGDVLGRLVVTDSHWGLIEGTGPEEEYADPLTLVGGGPVRLLPLWREEPVSVRTPWTPPLERWRRPVDSLP
jgi:murein DD-endopeptidase MepM/ murein hydrolase activator NlpD